MLRVCACSWFAWILLIACGTQFRQEISRFCSQQLTSEQWTFMDVGSVGISVPQSWSAGRFWLKYAPFWWLAEICLSMKNSKEVMTTHPSTPFPRICRRYSSDLHKKVHIQQFSRPLLTVLETMCRLDGKAFLWMSARGDGRVISCRFLHVLIWSWTVLTSHR